MLRQLTLITLKKVRKKMEQNSEIIIYTAPDGTTKLQVQLEDETVWLTQDQMAMLFGKAKSTINEHIKIFMQKKSWKRTKL